MPEGRLRDLPTGVWFWRKNSQSRWVVEGAGYIDSMDSVGLPAAIDDPDEIVLIDPNWCPVCFYKMPWPPGVTCPDCGDDRNEGVLLDEFRGRIGAWVGIDPAIVHI